MDDPTAHRTGDSLWLCRNVSVDGKEQGLALVRTDSDGNLLSLEPFVRETPATVYFEGRIEITQGKVRLLPR